MQIYREVTVDAAILDDPASAPETIDRVLRNVVASKRPGISRDPARPGVGCPVAEPAGPLLVRPDAQASEAMAGAIDEAVDEIVAMLAGGEPARALRRRGDPPPRPDGGRRPAGRAARRAGRHRPAGQGGVPREPSAVRRRLSRGAGRPGVRSLLDESDCVLGIGVMATDLGTGFWTQRIHPRPA